MHGRDPWAAPLNEDFRPGEAGRGGLCPFPTLGCLGCRGNGGSAVAHQWWEDKQRLTAVTTARPVEWLPPCPSLITLRGNRARDRRPSNRPIAAGRDARGHEMSGPWPSHVLRTRRLRIGGAGLGAHRRGSVTRRGGRGPGASTDRRPGGGGSRPASRLATVVSGAAARRRVSTREPRQACGMRRPRPSNPKL